MIQLAECVFLYIYILFGFFYNDSVKLMNNISKYKICLRCQNGFLKYYIMSFIDLWGKNWIFRLYTYKNMCCVFQLYYSFVDKLNLNYDCIPSYNSVKIILFGRGFFFFFWNSISHDQNELHLHFENFRNECFSLVDLDIISSSLSFHNNVIKYKRDNVKYTLKYIYI